MRRFVFILLMLMLPWQAIASAVGAVGALADEAADNAVVDIANHELRVAHHHHDDGSVAYDNTDASRHHLLDYPGGSGAVMLTSFTFGLAPPTAGIAPPEFSPLFLSGPFLEGLRRPPRALG